MQALAAGSDAPVDDVRIYRHMFTWFTLFPGKKSVETGPDGTAVVTVGPSNTNLTMLRQGYEPVLLGVFEQGAPSIQPDDGGYDYVLLYSTIKDKQVVPVEFRPVRRVPLQLHVVDADSGQSLAGATVFGTTYLYLPQPGVEADWGYPPVQEVTTSAQGQAVVDQVSGFRNRVTVRKPGYCDAELDIDGRKLGSAAAREVALRPFRVKHVDFQVFDASTRMPVAGAEVVLGEQRDGLPMSPDGWKAVTGPTGRTGVQAVPNMEPPLMTVRAKGYPEWRGAPLWRALQDGGTKRIEIRK